MTKLYIVGPDDGGEGEYDILAETGEHLASHFCSNCGYALGDLEANRPTRQAEWRDKFGDYEVEIIGDDAARADLLARNKAFYDKRRAAGPE